MKIAIISDSHNNLVRFKKAVLWIEKNGIKTILHCGDICSPETIFEVKKGFSGKILITLGNADKGYGWEKYLKPQALKNENLKIFSDFGEFLVEDCKIAFSHFPKHAKKLAKTAKYDAVFYGHTHKPWMQKIDSCLLANPGNLCGSLYIASFAVFDTVSKKLELKILEKL